MPSPTKDELLWSQLEIAVRTHSEQLPVDAFLPDPADRVAEIMQQRAEARKSTQPEEKIESLVQDDSFQDIIDETEIVEPAPPVDETGSIEDELRNQLSGNSFAEWDDAP